MVHLENCLISIAVTALHLLFFWKLWTRTATASDIASYGIALLLGLLMVCSLLRQDKEKEPHHQ